MMQRIPSNLASARTLLLLAALTAMLLTGISLATVPEPDAVVYGGGTNPLFPGDVVEARLDLDGSVLAISIVGTIPTAPEGYILRVPLESPLDGSDPRTPGVARIGDVVSLFLNGVDTDIDAMLSMRGLVVQADLPVDPDRDGDGFDADVDNCPTVANADQADADADGAGDACDTCTDADADGFGDPALAANTCPNDNCPGRSNASQSDMDADGTGDACETQPLLIVSSDPADQPDFATVTGGVGAVEVDGTTIRVLEGLGPYPEGVTLNSPNRVRIEGVPGARAVLAGSGTGPTLDIIATSGQSPVEVRDLVIEGDDGLRATVPTTISNCEFASITGTAIDITAGQHDITDVRVSSGATGLRIASGAAATIDRAIFENLSTGLQVDGSVEVASTLIADSSTGVVVGNSGSLVIDYATIAGNGVSGVDSSGSGTVAIAHSIVWNNATDLVGIACADVQSSDVGTPDCSGTNGNVSVDPALEPDYRLAAGSPVLEFIAPETFDGAPCRDLDGGPRLRDFDGDGLAAADLGAYEAADPSPEPEVANLRWLDADTLEWDPATGAPLYHVYRGDVAALAFTHFGDCQDGLDGNLTDTTLIDTTVPAPGQALFYLINTDSAGVEGTLGVGTCAERSRYAACTGGS